MQIRNDNEFKCNFPDAEEITRLAKNSVADGEIVISKQGKANFCALQERGILLLYDIERLHANRRPPMLCLMGQQLINSINCLFAGF